MKYLTSLRSQQANMRAHSDPSGMTKFRAGFAECIGQVNRFLATSDEINSSIFQALMTHLNGKLSTTTVTDDKPGLGSLAGIQLIPTRLATGDIALVLPQSLISTSSSPYTPEMLQKTVTVPKPWDFSKPSETSSRTPSPQHELRSSDDFYRLQNSTVVNKHWDYSKQLEVSSQTPSPQHDMIHESDEEPLALTVAERARSSNSCSDSCSSLSPTEHMTERPSSASPGSDTWRPW